MISLRRHPTTSPRITWEILPENFILPDDPVESNLQPLLAAALRESLELAGLLLGSMLVASNFGLCANVNDKTVVKAPDWVYIPSVYPVRLGEIRRSYTPYAEGDNPAIIMEFISATDATEYSIDPHYPYGKWHFYEQILKVPVYVIFHPKNAALGLYRLVDGEYQIMEPDKTENEIKLFWIESIGLFLGVWVGKKAEEYGNWLRWWDRTGNLLLWGTELVEQQRQLTEQAEQKAQKLAEKLRSQGVVPEEIG